MAIMAPASSPPTTQSAHGKLGISSPRFTRRARAKPVYAPMNIPIPAWMASVRQSTAPAACFCACVAARPAVPM